MGQTDNMQRAAVARHRGQIYDLLTAVYRAEPTPDFLQQLKDKQFLEVLAELGVQLEDDFLEQSEQELAEDLAVEYTRLFLGPGSHISPHESVHRPREDGQGGALWGPSTAEVKSFIEATGLSYEPEYNGMPDHISVELEFMRELTLREEQAWKDEDEAGALRLLGVEQRFLNEHLGRWVPAFCDKVIGAAERSFYRELAGLTKRFIEFEKQEIDRYGDMLG